jgi:cytochrome c556
VLRPLVVACCAVLCLAACGGAAKPKATQTSAKQCVSRKAIAKLNADIAAIRRARGNVAATNRTTDRFLLDVATAPVTNLKRNRMIDHAVGALGGECEQCFQALEAARPIPNIRTGARC